MSQPFRSIEQLFSEYINSRVGTDIPYEDLKIGRPSLTNPNITDYSDSRRNTQIVISYSGKLVRPFEMKLTYNRLYLPKLMQLVPKTFFNDGSLTNTSQLASQLTEACKYPIQERDIQTKPFDYPWDEEQLVHLTAASDSLTLFGEVDLSVRPPYVEAPEQVFLDFFQIPE